MWRQQQMCNVRLSITEASSSWQGKWLSEWRIDASSAFISPPPLLSFPLLCLPLFALLRFSHHLLSPPFSFFFPDVSPFPSFLLLVFSCPPFSFFFFAFLHCLSPLLISPPPSISYFPFSSSSSHLCCHLLSFPCLLISILLSSFFSFLLFPLWFYYLLILLFILIFSLLFFFPLLVSSPLLVSILLSDSHSFLSLICHPSHFPTHLHSLLFSSSHDYIFFLSFPSFFLLMSIICSCLLFSPLSLLLSFYVPSLTSIFLKFFSPSSFFSSSLEQFNRQTPSGLNVVLLFLPETILLSNTLPEPLTRPPISQPERLKWNIINNPPYWNLLSAVSLSLFNKRLVTVFPI